MAFRILIDGYNLIRNYSPLARMEERDFSQGREMLLEWLSAYRMDHPEAMTVVFDGVQGGGYQEEHDLFKGIMITFSPRGQTADDIIKRLIAPGGANILVVTSDRDLAQFCRSRGAGTIGAREFANRIQEKLEGRFQPDTEDEPRQGAGPRKKKGLSRRPSKKKKREMKHWRKI